MGSDFYTKSILPYANIIIKLCHAYTNSQQDFEDYYQEVCLQIWRSKDKFNGQSQWSTWVYRIALNVCLTYLKKKSHNQLSSGEPIKEEAIDCQAFSSQEINQLYQAIKQLSEIDRAVILLYLEEWSYQEIADTLGTNVNNIGVRVKRIKQRLNKLLHMESS